MTLDHLRDARLIISAEPGTPSHARVIGSLTADSVKILLEAVEGGVSVLDLAEVDRIDESAVQVLTRLSRERCTLEACPRWLELWLERVRRNTGA